MKPITNVEIENLHGGFNLCAFSAGAGIVTGVATMLTLPVGAIFGGVVTVVNIGCTVGWW